MTVVGATAGAAARAKGMARPLGTFTRPALLEGLGPHLHRWLWLEGTQAWMAVPIALEAARAGPATRIHVSWTGHPTSQRLL